MLGIEVDFAQYWLDVRQQHHAWLQQNFGHDTAPWQIVWIGGSTLVSLVIIRTLFDEILQSKLNRLQLWLGGGTRSSHILKHLIENRFQILALFLIWIGTKLFAASGAAWLLLVQNILIAGVIVAVFQGYFRSQGVARIFRICVVGVCLINGLNLFDVLLPWLEWPLFAYGERTISLLLIAKSLTFLLVGVWLVNLVVGALTSSIGSYVDITPSLRLLISKLSRFGLYFLVVMISIESLGIQLQSLSFFAGAIGLGLGFGLQKLIANLSSGMVLLADKSIKPGDFIEVEGRKGVVKEMTSRAVRITDLKNIDYIIPNQSLIDQTIINWSLHSNDVWMFVTVGVAYDTDLDLAMRCMREAAEQEPLISKENPVSCFVREFGDSAIELLVSFVVDEPKKGYFGIQSNIRYTIWRKFKENQIEIPFPQRDLHIHPTHHENPIAPAKITKSKP